MCFSISEFCVCDDVYIKYIDQSTWTTGIFGARTFGKITLWYIVSQSLLQYIHYINTITEAEGLLYCRQLYTWFAFPGSWAAYRHFDIEIVAYSCSWMRPWTMGLCVCECWCDKHYIHVGYKPSGNVKLFPTTVIHISTFFKVKSIWWILFSLIHHTFQKLLIFSILLLTLGKSQNLYNRNNSWVMYHSYSVNFQS